jgi:hypothetical protein
LANEIEKSNLNLDKNRITFINVVVDSQDRLGTGEIKIVQLNNEYDLRFTANSMLVIAFAGLNIEQAVIYKVAMKTLNQDKKGRARKCFMELEF